MLAVLIGYSENTVFISPDNVSLTIQHGGLARMEIKGYVVGIEDFERTEYATQVVNALNGVKMLKEGDV